MKKLILVLALLSSQAFAVDFGKMITFDAGLGVTKYKNNENGLWYVTPFEHDMTMVAPSAEGGVSLNLIDRDDWGIDTRLGFVYLGSIETDALVPSWKTNTRTGGFNGPDFQGADQKDPCFGECTNMTRFHGVGSDRGFTWTLEPYLKRNGVKYGIFGGVYIHKTTWSMHLTGANDCKECEDYSLDVEYNQGWKKGYVAGISITKDNLYIKYSYFNIPRTVLNEQGTDAFPPAFGSAHMLSIGIKF